MEIWPNEVCDSHIGNNLCLYCGLKDHKIDGCPRKQLIKARLTTLEEQKTLPSENLSENQSVVPKTQHKLKVVLNSFVQLQVQCISMRLLFLILIPFVYPLFLLWCMLWTISSLYPSECWQTLDLCIVSWTLLLLVDIPVRGTLGEAPSHTAVQ